MQRRQVEFIKKRVLLLEKGLNAEYQKEYFGDPKANEVANEEPKSEPKATNFPSYKLGDTDAQMIDQLPQLKAISAEEISLACDNDPNRSELVHLYNEMCKAVEENPVDRVRASLAREPADVNVAKNFLPLETICEDMQRILTPSQPDQTTADKSKLYSDDCKLDNTVDNESKDMEIELETAKESRTNLEKENGQSPILPGNQENDTEMDESKIEGLNGNTEKSDARVVVLEGLNKPTLNPCHTANSIIVSLLELVLQNQQKDEHSGNDLVARNVNKRCKFNKAST
ncbi:hypothetical protein PIB30_037850 [Stylosanthes scabra]|uniref:Uncharacterized protein n=1 Tax=Stylosanthes scabra TaxID=79078 RepID=A0ABU6UD48_9FABA|nr:hypothetical protein [Stylosanthes scabra]